jgi:hypothetical protein
VASLHVDGVFVAKGDVLGKQTLFHHFWMTKGPSTAQESIAIDHPMEWQIQSCR